MPERELKSLFERLREHLPDGEASAQQRMLMEQIAYHLHDQDKPDPTDPSLRDSIELLIEELEADHPTSAAIARNILETLGNIGI